MSALSEQPKNRDYLLVHNFRFFLRKLPGVNFFCTQAHIPGLNAGVAKDPTPTFMLSLTGDHPTYEDLVIEFQIDEDLQNWREIRKWIKGDTFPLGNYEYRNLEQNLQPEMGLEADAILYILDSAKNPKIAINYIDCKPIALSGIDMNVQTTTTEVATAQAVFRFSYDDLIDIV